MNRRDMTTGEAAAWRDGAAWGQRQAMADLAALKATVERQTAEIASLRLTLGGRTYSADVPEPIGCPCPGACVQVAEIGRLRAIVRVNALRHGYSHEDVDAVLDGETRARAPAEAKNGDWPHSASAHGGGALSGEKTGQCGGVG